MPPASEATTGTPHAIASSAASPNDSSDDGSRKTSPAPITPSIGETLPRNSTRCAIPASRTKRSANGRSGPSPTIARCAGTRSFTCRKISSTSRMRLTGRKLDACTRSGAPSGERRRRCAAAKSASQRSGSTKFGITSTSRVTPSNSCVSSASDRETAVTASARSMPRRTIGKNEGSAPTTVMSVPCSVTISFGPPPRISRARYAEIACGIA